MNILIVLRSQHIQTQFTVLVCGRIDVLVNTNVAQKNKIIPSFYLSHKFTPFLSLSVSTDYWRALSAV